jgi:hypothetical protein
MHLIYLLIAISGGSGTQGSDSEVTKNSTMGKTDAEKTTSDNTITEIVFLNNEDVELKVGESASGQVKVNAKKKSESLLDAIELISENTDVVTITIENGLDYTNPRVSSASIYCPAEWVDKVTDDMVSQANLKGWNVYIGEAKL